MKNSSMLTIASLLLLLFLTFHLADDIVRGFEPGGLANLIMVVPFSVVWLYGTLVLAERRSGYIIMLLLSLFSFLFRLDADRDRRARALLRHPLGARTVEPAMAPAPIVQRTRIWNGPSHGVGDRRGSGSAQLGPHWFVSFRKTR
jgi:hypothetical protein